MVTDHNESDNSHAGVIKKFQFILLRDNNPYFMLTLEKSKFSRKLSIKLDDFFEDVSFTLTPKYSATLHWG